MDEIATTLPPHSSDPTRFDLFVIMTLWTPGTVQLLLDGLRDSFVVKMFPYSLARIANATVASVAMIVFTMAAVALMIDRHPEMKFWVYFAGLALYFLTPIFAFGMIFQVDVGAAISMIWLSCFWYAVHPLRFLLIFHQVFPIKINHSNLLVTVNETVNTIIHYITEVWVVNADSLSKNAFITAWSIMIGICIFWLLLTMLAKRYVNPVPEKLDAVRGIYEPTEAIHNFNRKQQLVNVVLLLCILYPGIIFSVMETIYGIGIRNLVEKTTKHNDIDFLKYRVDLIVTLVVIFIMELISVRLRNYRNEIVDLVFIAAGYLLNIVVLALLFRVVTRTSHLPSANVNYCNIVIYAFPKYYSYNAIYMFQLGRTYLSLHSFGKADGKKYLNAQVPVLGTQIKSARMFLVPTGEVVFDTKVELTAKKRILYQRIEDSPHLRKIDELNNFIPGQREPQFLILNPFQDCDDYDKSIYNATGQWNREFTRGIFLPLCQLCAPFKMELASEDGKKMYKIPSANEGLGPISLPCEGDRCLINVTFNNEEYFYQTKGIVVHKNYIPLVPYQMYIFRIEQDPDSCFVFRGKYFEVVDKTVNEPIVAEGTFGAAMAMVSVSYSHLMWAEVSVKYRTFIVYSFYAFESIAIWITRVFILEFTPTLVAVLLISFSVGLIWHSAVTMVYAARILEFQRMGTKAPGFKRL